MAAHNPETSSAADLLRAELSAAPIGTLLDVADERLGRETVDRWIAEWNIDLREIVAKHGWVSLRLAEMLLDRIVAAGGRELVERAGRLSISPKHMGPIFPLFRALANPLGTYERMRSSSPRYNKAHEIRFDEARRGHVRARLLLNPEIPRPQTFHVCALIQGQLTSVPALFDHPPATVVHERCMGRGDPDCVYEVRWNENVRGVTLWLPWLVGALVGGGLGWWLALSWPLIALLTATGAVSAWAIALVLRQRRSVDGLVREIHDHHEALAKSLRDNERRYDELLEAKRDVDRQVQERTAELADASAQLTRTLAELRALDRAKTDFFNNVSHELRTPLTLLIAPLDDLVQGREPPGGTKVTLEAMRRNAAQLLSRINQLLDLAKVEAGHARLDREPVDLVALAQRVVEGFLPVARARGVAVAVEAAAPVPELLLDAAWIESALTNLVTNAVKILGGGGHVTVRVVDRGGEVLLAVEDDGPGIPADVVGRIFERFSQADDAPRGGTGLGLALVREAARLHGGEARVESEPGRGTTFTLTLPRLAASDRPTTTGAETAAARSSLVDPVEVATLGVSPVTSADEDRAGPSSDAPLALVAEDNADLRRFLADVLAPRYRVKVAADGRTALQLARDHAPDAVVSDIQMPGMNGIELTRALRAQDVTRATPVVLVTAHGELGQVLEGFDAGADDYLIKPVHGRELLARVGVHVRLRRMLQRVAHQERLATLGVVAASVAHNVRNPLTALVSGLPAMRQRLGDRLDPSSKEMMGVMIQCAERIERMTVDLLDLSRIDREAQGSFAPGAGLIAAVRLISARLPPAVTIDAEVDEDPLLIGRAGDVNHVFLNLIDNASKAVGESGKIRVEGRVEAGCYVVRVSDSGPGIAPAVAGRLFEPFVTTRPAGEGTGLGLSIARDVVVQHGGTIDAGRGALGGACFTVHLPLPAAAQGATAAAPCLAAQA